MTLQSMATRIGHSRLTRLCGPTIIDLGAARKDGIFRRSFSSTRIFAQDTETAAPTHGFSNGQNLGSIALKKNSVYLENKLRIVRDTDQRFIIIRF
jgi:trimethyllysine dioxygenase